MYPCHGSFKHTFTSTVMTLTFPWKSYCGPGIYEVASKFHPIYALMMFLINLKSIYNQLILKHVDKLLVFIK